MPWATPWKRWITATTWSASSTESAGCATSGRPISSGAAPLVSRIQKLLDTWGNPTHGLLAPACDRGMAPLLMAWLVGSAEVKEFTSGLVQYGNTWRVAVVARLTALAQRVVKRIAAPLLAAPTHRGGWIDPLVWVERWRRLIELKVDVPEVELSQSLLRLAPDGRPAALERAREIECPLCEVIVWVLGGTVDAAAAKRAPAVWIAASRCRDPEIVLEGGGWSKGLPTGPEVLQPAVYRWKALKGTRRHNVFTGATQYEEGGDEPAIGFEIEPSMESANDRRLLAEAQRAVSQEYQQDGSGGCLASESDSRSGAASCGVCALSSKGNRERPPNRNLCCPR